ncbi:50S ribosomal protein L22 [Mycoplasmatota bacterium]|nr:50S ribosomal protein L22 [Mycoplasmatota bacterium]
MIRIAPRKVRLVIDLVRGKDCGEAISILRNTNKRAAKDVEKLIVSAMNNAEHNNDMDINNLYVKTIYANEGPTLKRIRPRARGSASRILKRTSSITVFVAEKE